jgi:hypothetical protein
MDSWWFSLPLLGKLYALCALVGGVVFLLRLLFQIFGGLAEDIGLEAPVAGDSDLGFQVLSIQGLMAFFLMFGLVGLGLLPYGELVSFAGGALAGGVSVQLLAKLFLQAGRLQSSGTLNLDNSVGQTARVYLTIPAHGMGKVQVVIQKRLMVLDAMAADPQQALATGDTVTVVRVEQGNVLVVTTEQFELNKKEYPA